MTIKSLACLTMFAVVAVGCCRAAPSAAPPTVDRPVLTSARLGEVHGGPASSSELAELVRDVRRVVVNITAVEAVRLPDPAYGKDAKPSATERRFVTFRHEMEGAGVILDSSGPILTNAHLVGSASVVRIRLWDDRELLAHVRGIDPLLDVALLGVEGVSDLPAATLGSSADVAVGDPVFAIGNPFGFKHSVTAGIVSAKTPLMEGPLGEFLQTDAAINPGNSGGPLFNRRGEVIGINTAIAVRGQGIGFAVPIDAFREVLPQLFTKGYVERGDLGFQLQTVDAPLAKALRAESLSGVLVSVVEVKGPAERAGVQRGDIVLSIDGVKPRNPRDLEVIIARKSPGSRVALSVLRNGKPITLQAEVGELDPDEYFPSPPPPPKPKGWGVELVDDRGEVVVRDVAVGSALDGRLQRGDFIVEVDRAPVSSAGDVERRWSAPGPHLLWIRREGVPSFVGLDR